MRGFHRNGLAVLAAGLIGATAPAQVHHDALTIRLSFEPGPLAGRMIAVVRIVNTSRETVNLPVPGGIDCEGIPGTAVLEWSYKGDETTSKRTVQGIATTCPAGLALDARPSRRFTWMHFAPGQYVEVRDTITTASLIAGTYSVRAVYRAPRYDSEAKSDLRYAGIETPRGEYKGKPVLLTVGSEPQ